MVNLTEIFPEIVKINQVIIPMNFKSKYDFLHHLRHFFIYDYVKKTINEGNNVLEVGFGEGYGSASLASELPNSSIIGLDIDEKCVSHARSKYKFENLKFKLYNGKKIPSKNSSFDAVISFQVIEHVKDDLNFVSEIYRVLKPKGALIISSVNRFHRLKHGQKPWNIEHIREYYPHELYALLKSIFTHVQLLGIVGKAEIQDFIISNYNQGKKLNKKWFYYTFIRILSQILPKSFKHSLKLLLNMFKKQIAIEQSKNEGSQKLTAPFYQNFSLTDFSLIKNNFLQSLDILCICKK